jgi:hypothetical protein
MEQGTPTDPGPVLHLDRRGGRETLRHQALDGGLDDPVGGGRTLFVPTGHRVSPLSQSGLTVKCTPPVPVVVKARR